MVSICCISYNHAPFIRKCLDGFLMQECDFAYEILIHDDCSTDGTDAIIREYAAQYPDKIFPIYEEENMFRKGYAGHMDAAFNYPRARGKYIALCEADDYWTDSHKLQKQVDFLESHPDYSVTFHRCTYWNSVEDTYKSDNLEDLIPADKEGIDLDLDLYFRRWITMPMTMVFRFSDYDINWYKQYRYHRDMHEIYHLLKVGKGYIFGFNGGVHILHKGGISSMISREQYCNVSLPIDREFYYVNRDEYSRKNYKDTLEKCCLLLKKDDKWLAMKLCWEFGKVSGYWKQAWTMFRRVW